jgi:hypothetical protein
VEDDPDGVDEDEADAPKYKYYRSDKILGKLYRAVDEKKFWDDHVKGVNPSERPDFWNRFIDSVSGRCQALGTVMWTHRTETARQIRDL